MRCCGVFGILAGIFGAILGGAGVTAGPSDGDMLGEDDVESPILDEDDNDEYMIFESL